MVQTYWWNGNKFLKGVTLTQSRHVQMLLDWWEVVHVWNRIVGLNTSVTLLDDDKFLNLWIESATIFMIDFIAEVIILS